MLFTLENINDSSFIRVNICTATLGIGDKLKKTPTLELKDLKYY